ncbi:C-C motif chemokine 4 homolog [Melanotaenia boesemani]|uniref:C-C motif chemokine 4 homolog n=1 Tax=Melanotaenia boesemani TaxID=1250792 RepID=UPI001C0497CF|nr:C-C motif chemokine 4 homolog [Melanotaenia boesemani]
MMKTLFFALGLLIYACCSNAMPSGLEFNTSPRCCCFQFSSKSLPLNRVSTVAKTHHSCRKKGFIVQSISGRKICYEENFQWAQNVYNRLNTKGSGCSC